MEAVVLPGTNTCVACRKLLIALGCAGTRVKPPSYLAPAQGITPLPAMSPRTSCGKTRSSRAAWFGRSLDDGGDRDARENADHAPKERYWRGDGNQFLSYMPCSLMQSGSYATKQPEISLSGRITEVVSIIKSLLYNTGFSGTT